MNEQLAALQQAIQVLHQLMTILDDPKATAVVSKCLTALAGVQQEMMTQAPGGAARQGFVQQLQGQQGGQQSQGGGGY